MEIESQYTSVSWTEPVFTNLDGTLVGGFGNYIASGGRTLSLLVKLNIELHGKLVN